MKLYVYKLKDYCTCKRCEIQLEILECEEKPNTYKVLSKSPWGYSYIRKNEVGLISYGIEARVVLLERNDKLAIKLFEENQQRIVERAKEDLEKEENKLKQITENGVIEL